MKLRDLIERLEAIEADLRDALGDDVEAEVFAAIQPGYPLAVTVGGAAVLEDDETDEPQLVNGRPIVWITTGCAPRDMSPYAPGEAWEAAR